MTRINPPGLCADCGTVDGHREDCQPEWRDKRIELWLEEEADWKAREAKLEAENERVSQGWVDAERRLLEAEERLTTLRREATAALAWCPSCLSDGLSGVGDGRCPTCAPLRAAIADIEGTEA